VTRSAAVASEISPVDARSGFAFPAGEGIMTGMERVAEDAGWVYHRLRGPLRSLDGRILRAGEEP
jgi:hypothetical protein